MAWALLRSSCPECNRKTRVRQRRLLLLLLLTQNVRHLSQIPS